MKFIKKFFAYLLNPRAQVEKYKNTVSANPVKKVGQKGTSTPEGSDRLLEEMPEQHNPFWHQIINPPLVVGGIICLLLILIILFGPYWATYNPYVTTQSVRPHFDMDLGEMISPPFAPSSEYPLGSDRFGNDLLSLLFYGARVTLVAGAYITLARVFLGLVLGGLAGWFEGKWIDKAIMGTSVAITAIPLLLSAMILIYALDIQKGLWVFVFALSVLGWTEIAQLIRGEFIRIREMLYIEAAEAVGLNKLQILVRHALPNVFSYLISLSFLELGAVLLLIAELGFLGIYIGGGSRFSSDPFAPGFTQLVETPEWGALVALGTPFFRSNPHMVFGPALAFFVSIVGLNALGEGLRRLFDRWPFSTAILLRKRMLVVVAVFVAFTVFVFQRTSPVTSYQRVAQDFDANQAAQHLQILTSLEPQPADSPITDYLKENLREYGMQRGWRSTLHSYYYYPITTTIVKPLAEPLLQVGDSQPYQPGEDFAFLTGGCGGSGRARAALTVVGGISPPAGGEVPDLRGQVALVVSPDPAPDFPDQAAAWGAVGVLLVRDTGQTLTSQYEVPSPPTTCSTGDPIPVFTISPAVAEEMLSPAALTLAELSSRAEQESFLLPLEVEVSMALELSEPQTVEIPNAVVFSGGYDMDYAHELVVVFTSFDGVGLTPAGREGIPPEEAVSVAAMLESARLWQEKKLDPRRSVIFVMWGGKYLDNAQEALLQDLWEVNKLNPEVPAAPVKPFLWVQVGPFGAENPSLVTLSPEGGADPGLHAVMVDSLDKVGLDADPSTSLGDFVDTGLPSAYLWDENAESDPAGRISPDELHDLGETLNLVLIRLLREIKYTPMSLLQRKAVQEALGAHTYE